MGYIALAIVLCMCLYLVDKNQKWRQFRRWGFVATAALVLLVIVAIEWQDHALKTSLDNSIQRVKWDK